MSRSQTVVLASDARTTAQAVTLDVPQDANGVVFNLEVTADPAAASITPSIVGYDSAADVEWTLLTGAAVSAEGNAQYTVGIGVTASANVAANAPLPARIKFKVAVADADSMTYSVNALWW